MVLGYTPNFYFQSFLGRAHANHENDTIFLQDEIFLETLMSSFDNQASIRSVTGVIFTYVLAYECSQHFDKTELATTIVSFRVSVINSLYVKV